MLVSIVIPTCDRNDLLVEAVRSCLEQQSVKSGAYEVIIVDNSPDAGARGVVAENFSGPQVVYVHEPRPGVSHARNTGVATATGEYVAFLDDDEKAPPLWLSAMLSHVQRGALAVFGPVNEYVDEEFKDIHDPDTISIVQRDLNLPDGADASDLYHYLGTGNSMFSRKMCFENDQPFALEFNEGGEDIHLLSQLRQRGIKLIWAADAVVDEYVPASRLTVKYQAERKFRAGQGRTRVELRRPRIGIFLAVFWIAAGFAQVALYSLCYLISFVTFSPKRKYLVKVAGGAGKVLFFVGAQGGV